MSRTPLELAPIDIEQRKIFTPRGFLVKTLSQIPDLNYSDFPLTKDAYLNLCNQISPQNDGFPTQRLANLILTVANSLNEFPDIPENIPPQQLEPLMEAAHAISPHWNQLDWQDLSTVARHCENCQIAIAQSLSFDLVQIAEVCEYLGTLGT